MIISFILYFILILLVLLIILISTPYSYQISYKYIDSSDYECNIILSTFYFKFVFSKKRNKRHKYIKILGFKKELKKRTTDKKIEIKDSFKQEQEFEKKKKDKSQKKSLKNKFPLKIITKDNIIHVLKFIKKLFKILIPKEVNINLTIGTDQPDLNGYILAYYYTLKETYPNIPLTIDINWQESTFKSDGYLKGYIIPIELIFKILLFVFSIPTIKIGWSLYKYKKRKDR